MSASGVQVILVCLQWRTGNTSVSASGVQVILVCLQWRTGNTSVSAVAYR